VSRHILIAVKTAIKVIKYRIDIVHLQGTSHDLSFIGNWLSVLAAKTFRAKVLWHIHDDFSDEKVIFPGKNVLTKQFFYFLIKSADILGVLSEQNKSTIEMKHKRDNVVIIPPCVSISNRSVVHNQDVKTEFVILYVGWLVKDKGIFDLLQIAEKLNDSSIDVKFIVLGTGMSDKETNLVKQKVEDYNLSKIFKLKGIVLGDEKENYFKHSNVFISPTYWDAFPMVIIEAMAFGLPIITTNVGGIPEIIGTDGSAVFHKPGDIDGMTNSIIRLMKNKELCKEMGTKNKIRFVQNFHLEIVSQKTVDIYNKLSPL
jgi:glycosyltransferase involved in cell wall biosynthesis